MCAAMLVKHAFPTAPCPSPPSKKGHSNEETTELVRARSTKATQLTCHACSCVLQGVQCGNADAIPRKAAAVGRHASARESTKIHTANRLRVTWSAGLLGVRRAGIVGRVVGGCHAFELGGTIDALGDVAFVRDEIMVSFLLHLPMALTLPPARPRILCHVGSL